MVKILDLFCGMGGLSLGFTLGLKGAEILGLDIDRYAVETYNYNLNRLNAEAKVQDILRWEPQGEHDIIIAGVPCQPFSTANVKKRGKEHPLYPTFPRFFDIILELKPKAFLMENVKGLVTRRHRPLLEEQLRRVEPYYNIRYKVLNAAYYGVPQRRERLFVLGIRRDLGIVPSFPSPTHAEEERTTLVGKLHRWVTVREAIGDLLATPPMQYPKKLVQTNPRHGKPIDVDKPSRVVKVDGRGGDFTFDTMLVPLTPEQVERIRREREDTTRHLAKMEFPDSLDKPSRTISSHTVEGTKRETIIIPVTEHVGSNVKVNIANPKGFGDASKVPNKLDLPAKTVMKGGGSCGAIPPLVELPTEHVMTEKGGWSNPKSDWGSRVMPEDKPSYTITEKHRSGQLVKILIPSEHEVRGYIDPEKQFKWTWARRHPLIDEGKVSPTIVGHIHKNLTKSELTVKDRVGYRRLTVRECLRLQGFPDWWSFPKGVSVSRKYKLVGEAVCPILAYRLAIHIGKLMGWGVREPPKAEEWRLPYFRRAFADYFA